MSLPGIEDTYLRSQLQQQVASIWDDGKCIVKRRNRQQETWQDSPDAVVFSVRLCGPS